MKKSILIAGTLVVLLNAGLSAQQQNDSEEIYLPEITTVISTEKLGAEEDSVPDFSKVVRSKKSTGDINPVLPDESSTDYENKTSLLGKGGEKSIYAEGRIGGGYPNLFLTDFNVYRLDGTDPFRITFSHENIAGFSSKSLTEGYSNSNTSMLVEKGFSIKNFQINLNGLYNAEENGLQSKEKALNSVNLNEISGNASVKWNLSKGVELGTSVELENYNRYSVVNNENTAVDSCVKAIENLYFSPELSFGWTGNGLNVGLVADFDLFADLKKNLNQYVDKRGNFAFNISWSNEYIKLFADSGIVVGTNINKNTIVPPFLAGIESEIPVSISDRSITLNAKGGLESYANKAKDLEQKYKFSYLNVMPTETSFWNGNVKFELPVQDFFNAGLTIDYKQTAFNNGIWQPVYAEKKLNKGLYGFEQSDAKFLHSSIDVRYLYKIVSATVSWQSNWIDVPVLETAQLINVELVVQNDKSTWNGTLNTKFFIGEQGALPMIDLSGFMNITPSVRIMASLEDIIVLFGASPRTYGGQYISKGGSGNIMVKFIF